jgi:hypothetical protein
LNARAANGLARAAIAAIATDGNGGVSMTAKSDGYLPFSGLYKSRYYAKKDAVAGDVVVKTAGGYAIVTRELYDEYRRGGKTDGEKVH